MGSIKLSLFLAFKSIIKGNRWALLLIILVMSLSFANLMLTPSILSGVTHTLDQQQVQTLLGNIVIDPSSTDYYIDHASQIEQRIEQMPGISGVSAHLDSGASIEYQWTDKEKPTDKGKGGTWSVVGIDPENESKVTAISQSIIQGSYLNTADRNQIVLGVDIAGGEGSQAPQFQTLQGARVGDEVRLTFTNGIQEEFTVKGIFQAQDGQADRMAFINRRDMVNILGRDAYNDKASQILVSISQSGQEKKYVEQIKALNLDAQVRPWYEYGGSVGGIISSFDMISSLIGGIGLVVAGIAMFIVIYINVINKKRQIGILRAIGIKRGIIIGAYLAQALFYACSGIILGGLMFGYGIQPYFQMNPIELPIGKVSLAINYMSIEYSIVGLILAAILAGLVPALSITRQGIIQAIWGN